MSRVKKAITHSAQQRCGLRRDFGCESVAQSSGGTTRAFFSIPTKARSDKAEPAASSPAMPCHALPRFFRAAVCVARWQEGNFPKEVFSYRVAERRIIAFNRRALRAFYHQSTKSPLCWIVQLQKQTQLYCPNQNRHPNGASD